MNKTSLNIKVAYVVSFFNEIYFPIAIWIFFYLRYLSFAQIAFITIAQLISSVIFEIPTGAIADLIGRKRIMFASFFLYAVVMLFTAFSTQFWMFLILDIIKGLSKALYAGSLESIVYDTLKEEGNESMYTKVVSKMETLAWIGLFVSAIVGGILYDASYNSPYIFQAVTYFVVCGLILFMHEPKFDSEKYILNIKNFAKQNLRGFNEVFKNMKLAEISLIFIIIGAGYFVASELLGISQAKEYGLDGKAVGLLFGIGYIISAAFSYIYPWLHKKLGNRNILILVTITLISTFIFARYVGILLGCILIIIRISSSTTFRNLRSSVMNANIESKNRTTALSTVNLLTNLPYAIAAVAIGDYIDKQSPNAFAFVLGVIMIVVLVVILVGFKFRDLKNNMIEIASHK